MTPFMVNQMNNRAVSVITQTIVSLNDPAFQNPTKPIGPFYSEDEAKPSLANAATR